MLIGYARVSTKERKLEPQIDDLNKIGCEKIFSDIVSGAKNERPGINDLMGFIREGRSLDDKQINMLRATRSDPNNAVEDIYTPHHF